MLTNDTVSFEQMGPGKYFSHNKHFLAEIKTIFIYALFG